MDRRTFLRSSLATSGAMLGGGLLSHHLSAWGAVAGTPNGGTSGLLHASPAGAQETFGPTPSYSIIPVVGDGKWIWTEPPQEKRGYLEPRSFSLRLGIEMEGTGPATQIKATTTAPIEYPEQRIEDLDIKTQGCQAEVATVGNGAAVLGLVAPAINVGQRISAYADYQLILYKRYDGFDAEMFPTEQAEPPREISEYLGISPGIETMDRSVRQLCDQLCAGKEHPWERAEAFKDWVWENIEPQMQRYTSVKVALKKRIGDCEERSAIFVALARAAGIPARLVWVPNHNWTEFYLTDKEGKGHWIPAHTSAYSWFGWTGAHEVVLQKGDRHEVPYRRGKFRLIPDWASWSGSKPKIRWMAELRPEAKGELDDAGPGARSKDEVGDWKVVGDHPLDKYMRR